MSQPSAKRIEERLKVSAQEARELAQAMKRAAGDPYEADALLDRLNARLGGFGVEAIQGGGRLPAGPGGYYMDIVLLYVNRGDTYDDTVLYDTDAERFLVGSWGDWVEEHEVEEEEEVEEEL